jgi:hypothetical protein
MITLTIMSLVTSVKDYVEITHKLIEPLTGESLKNYTELGALFTYFIFSIGDFLKNFFSFSLFKNIWSIPIIIPDIASAMISEVSVLDGYFHNAFTFLETNVNTGTNPNLVFFEKFIIGLINSCFLFLPTSTSHLITLRRFVMQGLEAGYIAGLGTLAGNFLWLASIILGWRFFVIPWLSFDIFRYLLGFILLVKYIWDSSKERRMVLEDLSKWKIFLLNFLLALTEQTSIYPFISNLSIGPDASVLEGFPVETYTQFLTVHGGYLLGILIGSFSLLQFTCWFWENPAFSIYLWITTKSSLKITTSSYYKILNFTFLYCTMLCAIASIPYYGLDYTITNPIGLVPQDRILDQKKSQSDPDKLLTETAFLGINPTDKNSRIRDGVHARRERWKQRLIKYQAYDSSVYDQGVYDFLTIEDLNYGFDRFWLRRKMRNHQIRFRLFPGPWMRSLKKQLNNPNSQSSDNSTKAATGPRVEFFRILFEQFYHPNFHDRNTIKSSNAVLQRTKISTLSKLNQRTRAIGSIGLPSPKGASLGPLVNSSNNTEFIATRTQQNNISVKPGLIYKNSALRKFVRNFNTRTNLTMLSLKDKKPYITDPKNIINNYNSNTIYSKRWKLAFSKMQPFTKTLNRKPYHLFRNISKQLLLTPEAKSFKLAAISQKLSKKDIRILELRTQYKTNFNNDASRSKLLTGLDTSYGGQNMPSSLTGAGKLLSLDTLTTAKTNLPDIINNISNNGEQELTLLRPLNVYLQKEQAFKRKLRYYGTTPMRKLTVGNQAPYFKALMKRGFYYYKPSLRWKKTLYVASMRRGFRKKSRKQRILYKSEGNVAIPQTNQGAFLKLNDNETPSPKGASYRNPIGVRAVDDIIKPTHSYTVLGKRASRYRHQIYKDVLQHWYYTPFNRLLLKFDVDAFINRQPKSHFLTKNEERLLHVRRFLLSEHYDTLRWYTSMQHYRTMKTNIGGTKSFANRTYNQQFQGTFKKIRHLFAITPRQGDLYTLKFDQPLYNDNKLKDNAYFHEEILTDNNLSGFNINNLNNTPNPLKNVKGSSYSAYPEGVAVESEFPIQTLNTPTELSALNSTDFNTDKSLLNNLDLINEGSLLPPSASEAQSNILIAKQYLDSNKSRTSGSDGQSALIYPVEAWTRETSPKGAWNERQLATKVAERLKENGKFIYTELFVKLIKECKRRVHDQAFLKNYISHRIEKREQRNQEQNKELNKRLEKLKTWLTNAQNTKVDQTTYRGAVAWPDSSYGTIGVGSTLTGNSLTTGMQKAVNDGILIDKKAQTDVNYDPLYRSKPLLKTKIAQIKYKPTSTELKIASHIKTEKQILAKINLLNLLTNNGLTHTKSLTGLATLDGVGAKQGKQQSNSFGLGLSLQNAINKCKPILLGQTQFLKARTNKNLDWWRKKQQVITKRKTARKRDRFKKQIAVVNKKMAALSKKVETEKTNLYNTLYGNYEISDYLLNTNTVKMTDTNTLRKKQDNSAQAIASKGGRKGLVDLETTNIWQGFFTKKLRKKVSSKGRRYRSLSLARYLTATRKPRLVGIDGLTKIDNISSIKGSFVTKEQKQELINLEVKNNLTIDNDSRKMNGLVTPNATNVIKTSQIKKRSRHAWKKRSRHQFSRNHYKYRKRHIHGGGKLRVMNKKLKKLKATNELRQWWWNSFLPRYYNNIETKTSVDVIDPKKPIQINNRFKPLSNINVNTPETNLSRDLLDSLNSSAPLLPSEGIASPVQGLDTATSAPSTKVCGLVSCANINNVIGETTNNLPFYAGWDDSLRKFVVTNRLLSRRDAGLEINEGSLLPHAANAAQADSSLEFTNAPIQGLNEGSFLYWQTDMPFNSYNIDQFITTNQSFYAPIGWRRFEFRHSILKTWYNNSTLPSVGLPSTKGASYSYAVDPTSIANPRNASQRVLEGSQNEAKDISKNNNGNTYTGGVASARGASLIVSVKNMRNKLRLSSYKQELINSKKAIARRINKRYKLLKQMPNQLMYSPTGPLLTEVLPSHYISVFDQQYRFPRNRYLKRNLLKTTKKTTLLAMVDSANDAARSGEPKNSNKDFTLRKRIKPRRKYHRKRFIKKDGLIFPRRNKFTTINPESLLNERETKLTNQQNESSVERWRPSSKIKQKRKDNLRSKTKSNKRVKTNPLRLRQLRRREFQQILKPSQRYIPRNGGFTWPGDYLRLEVVEMPKLKTNNVKKTSLKQKINVQPVGIMPRKYLIEKHNIKVLKKKLEKAHSTNQLSKAVKEYKFFT